MVKLHARVTKEIMIDEEQSARLARYLLCKSEKEKPDISDIKKKFLEGVEPGSYEAGYIPSDWMISDLADKIPEDAVGISDVDL